jgi:hypothetical protein
MGSLEAAAGMFEDAEEAVEVVEKARHVILFLTASLFKSKAVVTAVTRALEAQKPLILIHERDPNFGGLVSLGEVMGPFVSSPAF